MLLQDMDIFEMLFHFRGIFYTNKKFILQFVFFFLFTTEHQYD